MWTTHDEWGHQVDPVQQENQIDEVHQVKQKQLFRVGGWAGGQKYCQEKSFGLSLFRSFVLSFFRSCVLSFFRSFVLSIQFNSISCKLNSIRSQSHFQIQFPISFSKSICDFNSINRQFKFQSQCRHPGGTGPTSWGNWPDILGEPVPRYWGNRLPGLP